MSNTKVKLSIWADNNNMNYRTALRRFKLRRLDVLEYHTTDNNRFYVVDILRSKDPPKIVGKLERIKDDIDSVIKEINNSN